MLLGATPSETYRGEFNRDIFIKEFKANKSKAFNARKLSF